MQERESYRTSLIRTPRQPRLWRALMMLPLFALSGACADDRLAQQRQAYPAAAQQLADGQPLTSEQQRLLQDYVLWPYLRSVQLQQQWRAAADDEAEAVDISVGRYLSELGEQPVAWRLRNAWLLSLAQRERWLLLRASLPDTVSDPLLRCHALRAQLELEQFDGLADAALAQWTQGSDQPSACNPVFDWLDQQGLITPARVRQRLVLALEAGQSSLARYLMGKLPENAEPELRWRLSLMRHPSDSLDRWLKKPDPAASKDWLIAAHWRLARRDPERAEALLKPLRKRGRFSREERAQMQRSVALGLAYDRHERAVELFEDLPDSALDEHVHEWRIRAALLHGEWKLAQRWLAQLPDAERDTARWQYWSGRVAALRKQPERAEQHYARAAAEREYYGFLAAERLGQRADPQHTPLPRDHEIEEILLRQPGLIRARELAAVGETAFARSEWTEVMQGLDARAQIAAAQLSADWNWHHQAIIVLAEQQQWDDVLLRFPLPHRAEMEDAARAAGVELLWPYTIARAESLFDTQAHSSAGAHGLMQMLPSTARQVARELGRPEPGVEDLYRPEINLPLATAYLRQLFDRFERWPMAMAAYNAGPHRIPGWQLDRAVDADIWIENLPFNETRGYVQRALMNVVIYGWRLSGEPTPLLPILTPIPAAETAS